MAHAGTHGVSENDSDRPKLLYGLNDKPPLKDSIFAEVMKDTARAEIK
ncbi:hypothetical protein [Synechocystis sp. PCC 7509]|nr:hypothetical protein [Synechocystis sp. PCC 7509]